jgi:hypothetical protein
MTPKEKALELINNFYINGIQDKGYSMEYADAKQCALICADEIINTEINQDYIKQDGYMLSLVEFYEEVKQEINKL